MCEPEAERERLRAQYAEIASLAGGLAHEIRNPLSTIRLNLDLLQEEVEDLQDPRTRRFQAKLQTIQRECLHLEEILNAFLRFARAGELQLDSEDLSAIVQDFIDFYQPQAQRHGIEISPHLASSLPPVRVDRGLMRQALLNLVQNAQQAMPEGGVLELQTCLRGDRVCLDIIDTGVGMSEAAQQKLFGLFYSTRPGGSGLGLPTVRKIIDAHHGTITCDSVSGRGTRFTITLPAA